MEILVSAKGPGTNPFPQPHPCSHMYARHTLI
jgi:hypothetical protein